MFIEIKEIHIIHIFYTIYIYIYNANISMKLVYVKICAKSIHLILSFISDHIYSKIMLKITITLYIRLE